MPDAVLEIMVNKGMFEYFRIITALPRKRKRTLALQHRLPFRTKRDNYCALKYTCTMGGTRTGRTETVIATNQEKNKYIFNLSLRKQQ